MEQSCPKCKAEDGQRKFGYSKAGTQRYICAHCRRTYMLNPKSRAYPEETVKLAMRIYYSGVSGRGVGKVLNMNKANIYNWIKKNGGSVDKCRDEI